MTFASLGVMILAVVLVVRLVSASSQSINGFGIGGLERPDLKFSLMTTTDLGPFWLAVENGYFREAGFTFDPNSDVTIAKSGAASVANLAAGGVDIAYATYPPFFRAQTRGEADIKLVADASSAGPNSCMVVVMPGGKIRGIEDLAGARIAVTARNTMADLMVMSTLRAHGVDHTSVKWVEMAFPSMAGALDRGAEQTVHAVSRFDVGTGPTENIPTAGFGASAEFVRANPKTVAAFQKVMERATTEAKADRTKVEPLLQEFAGVDAETARQAELLTFQSSLDAGRIQRVTDLMLEFGMIDEKIDASRIIAKAPNSR
jgi:NitT/TauT family transport system substrate-binding protein